METTLTQASREWASRPADQRFTSLTDLHAHCAAGRQLSKERTLPSYALKAAPVAGDNSALVAVGPDGNAVNLTHWSFGQLASQAGAPAGYLRELPSPLAADCLNSGLRKDGGDLGLLLGRDPETRAVALRAVTSPRYGRIWNDQITGALVERFGDGITGAFRVPGEFGQRVEVTKENTTLYASDRDMFVFLADEENRIELPNRRDGKTGSLARGFFVWNSEVGSATFGVSTFLFDYACKNRTVWGANNVQQFKVRHTSGAPHRFLSEIMPAIRNYANASTQGITGLIEQARASHIPSVETFLAERFTRSEVAAIQAAHVADEGRPIESLWDAANGVTGYARSVPYQNARVQLERKGGDILQLAA